MVQWDWQPLERTEMQVGSLAQHSGLRIWRCCSCSCSLVTAQIWSLAWELLMPWGSQKKKPKNPKDPSSKDSHILKYWGLLQCMKWGGGYNSAHPTVQPGFQWEMKPKHWNSWASSLPRVNLKKRTRKKSKCTCSLTVRFLDPITRR